MKNRVISMFLFVILLLAPGGCALVPHLLPERAPAADPVPSGSELRVHFLDVGQADCALLECGGQTMLIDGGNVEDSSFVVAYLDEQGIEHLDYMICTHAHEDHVGGLSGPLNTCTVGAVYAPVAEYESKAFASFVKYTEKQGLTVTVPQVDSVLSLGGATVQVLGPRKEYEQPNDTSIVLRVDFGDTSFLFTGDMERTAEEDLVAAGCDLNADVLKVGHHGSDTSTSYVFLRQVMPEYAVISMGADNAYEHPGEAVLSRLRDAGAAIYRTDQEGTILAVSDGVRVRVAAEREPPFMSAPTETRLPAREDDGTMYIGNRRSMLFHREDCGGLPAEHNRIALTSREAAVAGGYKPCGNCKP